MFKWYLRKYKEYEEVLPASQCYAVHSNAGQIVAEMYHYYSYHPKTGRMESGGYALDFLRSQNGVLRYAPRETFDTLKEVRDRLDAYVQGEA